MTVVALGSEARQGVLQSNPDALRSLVLPVLSLGLIMAATLIRYVRSAVLDVMNQDYVRTARAKGLTERTVVVRHAMRNALTPIITLGAPTRMAASAAPAALSKPCSAIIGI